MAKTFEEFDALVKDIKTDRQTKMVIVSMAYQMKEAANGVGRNRVKHVDITTASRKFKVGSGHPNISKAFFRIQTSKQLIAKALSTPAPVSE